MGQNASEAYSPSASQ